MADASKPEIRKLDVPEKSRTYHFPNGEVTLKDVVGLATPPGRSHRVETADGKKHIIPLGWLSIELDVQDWTY